MGDETSWPFAPEFSKEKHLPAGYASVLLSLLLSLCHLRKRNRQGGSAQSLDECWVLCIETAHGFDDRRIRGLSMSSKLLDRFGRNPLGLIGSQLRLASP